MYETKANDDLEEPLLENDQLDTKQGPGGGAEDQASKEELNLKVSEGSTAATWKANAVLDKLLWFIPDEDTPDANKEGDATSSPAGPFAPADELLDSLRPTEEALNTSLKYLTKWIQKGQFLFSILVLALASSLDSQNGAHACWVLAFTIILLPLWIATVILPVGGFPDVRFMDLLPMGGLIVIFLGYFGSPAYDDVECFLAVYIMSFCALPGTLCAKKIILWKTGGLGRVRPISLFFAVVSFFLNINEDPFFSLFCVIAFMQIPAVAILSCLGDSPLLISAVMTVVYPRFFSSIKELEDQNHEASQDQHEERDARLERQYAKLGGRSSSSKPRQAFQGELLFPIVMGILVLWSFASLLQDPIKMETLFDKHVGTAVPIVLGK